MHKELRAKERKDLVKMLEILRTNPPDSPYRTFIPQFMGTQADAEALTDYLMPQTPGNTDTARGELMFRGQCMSCHTWDGYRSMRNLLKGRDAKGIANIINVLHVYAPDSPYRVFMPPLVGTQPEVDALVDYLAAQMAESPAQLKH